MLLPPYLRSLGYDALPAMRKLDDISFVEADDHLDPVHPWYDLRDVLEYLSCVEFARQQLLGLPAGRAIGSVDVVPARYNSASLVFFAQATLDNVAVWLNRAYDLGLRGIEVSFYKNRIARLLGQKDQGFQLVLSRDSSFISHLNSYRMEWLHRLGGGANVYCDKNPMGADAQFSIQVPIDPTLLSLQKDSKRYLERIREVEKENGGKWLLPVGVFANQIADGTRNLTIALIDVALPNDTV